MSAPAYQYLLDIAEARLQLPRFVLDFETRCELDVRNVGSYKYATHPSCEVLIAAYNLEPYTRFAEMRQNTKVWTILDKTPPAALLEAVRRGWILVAHNSLFEYCIWQYVCVPKLGWPKLTGVKQTLDTANLVNKFALPSSLDKAAMALRLPYRKNPEGSALIKKFSTPPFAAPSPTDPDWHKFVNYGLDDTTAETAILTTLLADRNKPNDRDPNYPDADFRPVLEPRHQALAWITMEMNLRGISVDVETARNGIALVDKIKTYYNEKASKLSGRLFFKCTQRAKVKEWLTSTGLSLHNMQGKTIEKALRRTSLTPAQREMLNYYKIAGSSSVAKLQAMLNYACGDDTAVHELLIHHKARTGRWGGVGIQIHNFPRPTLPKAADYTKTKRLIRAQDLEGLNAYAEELNTIQLEENKAKAHIKHPELEPPITAMTCLVSALRSLIQARPMRHFKNGDYSAIEARALFYLADEKRALKVLAAGQDIYLDMASEIFGIPYERLTKASPERPLGKETILGAGYGVWVDAFINRVEEVSGIQLGKERAKQILLTYRNTYPRVPLLWAALEYKCIMTVMADVRARNPLAFARFLKQFDKTIDENWRPQLADFQDVLKRFKFRTERHGALTFLCIELQNGRALYYPNPRVVPGDREYKGQPQPQLVYEGKPGMKTPAGEKVQVVEGLSVNDWSAMIRTYGGKETENVTQGIAYEFMAEGMLNTHAAGYALVLTVHDELQSEDVDGFKSLSDFLSKLNIPPPWAPDMPLATEGWQGPFYRK